MNRKLGTIVTVAAALVLLGAVLSMRRSDVPVRAAKAQRERITNTISTNGKIEPVENFEAHAPGATTVKKIFVREGDRVKAGQLLLVLDDAEARAQAARALARMRASAADLHAAKVGGTQDEVLNAQTQLVKAKTERDSAQRNLEALKRLEQSGSASAAEVKEADNRLQRAEAEVGALEKKLQGGRYSKPELEHIQASAAEASALYAAAQEVLNFSNVRAPRDGTVYSLPLRQGAYVTAGDLLVQVADLSKVQVRAFVDEPEIGRLQQGQRVTLAWDAIPGRTWEGKVTRVPTTVIVRNTRTVGEVVCGVENPDLKLLPNINVGVTITTAEHDNALTIPREAIHLEEGKRFVYVIVKGELQRKDVETSVFNQTRIEVTRGLGENDEVALGSTNSVQLQSNMNVNVVKD